MTIRGRKKKINKTSNQSLKEEELSHIDIIKKKKAKKRKRAMRKELPFLSVS